ncbi:MAG: hypothetical protein M1608_16305 [Candidatus Omnitrophica bacterium]|nr:hypothetical protein [Candidatus Omnitrophota bacterium]
MNLVQLHEKLMAAARANPPSDAVPYAFEKRVMARLADAVSPDRWLAWWSRALWRAVTPCVAVMILLGVWTYWTTSNNTNKETLSVALENTVLAALDHSGDSW